MFSFSKLQEQAEALKQQAIDAANTLDVNVLSLDAMQDELDPTLEVEGGGSSEGGAIAAPSTLTSVPSPAPPSSSSVQPALAAAAPVAPTPAAAAPVPPGPVPPPRTTATGGDWDWEDDAPKATPKPKASPKLTPKKPSFAKPGASPAPDPAPPASSDRGQTARLKAALAEAEAREATVLSEATERVKAAESAREKLAATAKVRPSSPFCISSPSQYHIAPLRGLSPPFQISL